MQRTANCLAKLDRINKTLRHQEADRVPVSDFYWGSFLKRWREENLAQLDLRGVFPIWKVDSRELIREFIALGFGSVICCVNDAYLDESALGRNIDSDFVHWLPADVDPCGENGEYHSFAFAGPIFQQPLRIRIGEKVYRPVEETHPGATSAVCPSPGARQTKGFWFCDLLPAP